MQQRMVSHRHLLQIEKHNLYTAAKSRGIFVASVFLSAKKLNNFIISTGYFME